MSCSTERKKILQDVLAGILLKVVFGYRQSFSEFVTAYYILRKIQAVAHE